MTSRDTHDIEEYEKEKKLERTKTRSINIQPGLLIKLLAESEPCLFVNNSPKATEQREIDPRLLFAYAICCNAAKWHAQIQIDFDKSLLAEL